MAAIYVRTSKDLILWSDWKIAHYDTDYGGRKSAFIPESPVVVFRDGYYYLFRTHGKESGAYVFRSTDPMDFGIGDDAPDKYVTRLPVIAPEIIMDGEGNEYISKINDEAHGYGIRLCRLRWEEC